MSNRDNPIEPSCPVCGKECCHHLCDAPYATDTGLFELLGTTYVRSSWVHCAACNHLFQWPPLSDEIQERLYGAESLYRVYSIGPRSELDYLLSIDNTILDGGTHTGHARRLRDVIKKSGEPAPKLMCDFGAGFGAAQSAAEFHGLKYFGYELDRFCLDIASRLNRNVKNYLPNNLNNFDLLYSSQVFEHIPDPYPALAICHKLLRPGGVIAIDVPTHEFGLGVNLGPEGLKCLNWGHRHSWTLESIETALRRSGFDVKETWMAGGDLNVIGKKLGQPNEYWLPSGKNLSHTTASWRMKWHYLIASFIDMTYNLARAIRKIR